MAIRRSVINGNCMHPIGLQLVRNHTQAQILFKVATDLDRVLRAQVKCILRNSA